ncbi:MAG: hypothetical protein CFH06_01479 [Alphaproteobacteria bacterium MarineAlpha3_Bin5]|nr:MAG: hypothetical protein CFH06_01479 [Alphaproteobacteria bacterium MarineAlpha3_Bin5]
MVSKLFYKLAKLAVGELAQNPELQARTAKIVKERVVPGAITGWEKARPKLEQAKDAAISATKDIAEVARKNDPIEDPKKFLSEASRKFREKGKR